MPGTLTHSPAEIFQQLLVDLSLGVIPPTSSDWGVYATQEPDTPDKVITCYDTTGIHQGRTMADGEVQERYGTQIRVRSPNHNAGFVKANAILIVLDQSVNYTTVTVGSTNYIVYSVSRGATINYLGKRVPTSKRDIFTVNVTTVLKQTS